MSPGCITESISSHEEVRDRETVREKLEIDPSRLKLVASSISVKRLLLPAQSLLCLCSTVFHNKGWWERGRAP